MTYWPISSPSVFAATKHTDPRRQQVSHDGVEYKQPREKHDESNGGSHAQTDDEASTHGKSGVEEKDGGHLPQQSASDASIEDDIHGEIIAIRVTRSGQLFATLTRTTLTIWQTKACFPTCPMDPILIFCIAYGRISFSIAFGTINQNIRPQYRRSPPP
jgi:hypothetical protein